MSRRERVRTRIDIGDGKGEIDVTDAMARFSDARQLESFFSRLVRLETERRETSEAIKDIYIEAKSNGFHAVELKALKVLVKQALEGTDQRGRRLLVEEEVSRMKERLGQMFDTPLGQAAMARQAEAH